MLVQNQTFNIKPLNFKQMSKSIASTFSDADKQALMNAEGEMSPNAKTGGVIDQIMELASPGSFDHTHETITQHDAILVIIQSNFGAQKDSGEPSICGTEMYQGCTPDHLQMISNFLQNHPVFISIFKAAIVTAEMLLEEDNDNSDTIMVDGFNPIPE